MNHVLNGDINEDGEFGGWHMYPGNDPEGYPESRFINGEMVTNADGSVSVRGTVGSYDPENWDMTPKSSIEPFPSSV
ncbi:hypothetical protein AB0399_09950 [Streptomyces sp. NPDC088194]|uniref:hypothetical protein n=1 Tax=Streptomyces sp. NPDC088194 TaxID=3154931 RepID=UPI003450E5E2